MEESRSRSTGKAFAMSSMHGPKKETVPPRCLLQTLVVLPVALCVYAFILEIYSRPVALDVDLATNPAETPQQTIQTRQAFQRQLVDIDIPQNAEFIKRFNKPRVAIVTTTSGNVESTKLWIKYHSAIGVSDFYLFTNGQADHDTARQELKKWSGVKVFGNEYKLDHMKANSRAWNESWLGAFFNKPCNHELFVMQTLNMEVALKQGFKDGVEWMIHLDTDELFYPGSTSEYNIQQYLSNLDPTIDVVVFPNYEALPEHEKVSEPFLEASLFKRNFAHVRSDLYFKNYDTISKGNPNYFVAYGNGKSAARLAKGIRPNGAHRWYFYTKKPKEITSENAAILHYVYNKYSDLKGRRDRCDCAPTEEDTRRCFMLPFDREAFIKSSLLDDKALHDFFVKHLIWSNATTNFEMMRNGLLIREHTPQVLMRLFMQLPDYGLKPASPTESKGTVVDDYVVL